MFFIILLILVITTIIYLPFISVDASLSFTQWLRKTQRKLEDIIFELEEKSRDKKNRK